MTAAAVLVDPAPTRALPPLPSAAALALERMTWRELDRVFLRGRELELDQLVGWEFRGINTRLFRSRGLPRVFGIKKFVKGFYRDEHGRALGYNRAVRNNALDGRFTIGDRRFGFFTVDPVDPTARDNAYLHAILLDYSKGDNPRRDPSRGLRDYLVQVEPGNPDLLLGKAYFAVGPLRVASNFFILERHRVGLTDYARR
ncbi:MAG TPA: hypothetical protein VLX92_22600 [Kofleriaceae bacterium]|nr:hypothetical protein [Kofleriaceae bacterium]